MFKTAGLFGVFLTLAVSAPSASNKSTAIDHVLQTAVASKRVPGVVAMVGSSRAIQYDGAFGLSKDSIFAIASMTKPLTSVAVMQLVEAGKVKLDAPAYTYVPELKDVQVLEQGTLRPPKSAPTVRQLLTHTSGFAYEFMNKDLFSYVGAGKVPSIAKGDGSFLAAPLMFDPGERWEYGISSDWLGRLVERVSGESLEQYFADHIFAPLGMTDSFFNVPEDKQPRVVRVWQKKPDGTLVQLPAPAMTKREFLSGGGGLYSTAADYMRFTRALLRGGEGEHGRILKVETVRTMMENQIGALNLRPIRSTMPQLAADNAQVPGGLDKFGLGFALNSKGIANGRGANTGAWAGIYNTFFWVDREKDVAAVLMTQMLPGMDPSALQLMQEFDAAVYASRQ